jgi:D-alanyl-D-alanine carboxypeptidase
VTILPQLERDLFNAAEERLQPDATAPRERSGSPRSPFRPRLWRAAAGLPVILTVAVTIAIAVLAFVVIPHGRHASQGTPANGSSGAAPTSSIVYVSDHGRVSVTTSGAPRPRAAQQFRIADVTQTFTATLVLQLAEEGKLRLGDPIERYLPGVVPGGRHITIGELLAHTSGLANYTDYTDWLAQVDPSTSIRPIDVLRFAAAQPPVAPPNSGYQYSNTDYIALGLIIERVTGRSFAQELEQRILEPLGLRNTELATTRTPTDLHDRGINPNLSWAAGGIVSNAPDLARFFSALLSARLVSHGSLAQMQQTIALADGLNTADGLGIFSSRLPCGRAWGQSGSILDYATLVAASQDGTRVVVISKRTSSTPGPPDLPALLCSRHGTS